MQQDEEIEIGDFVVAIIKGSDGEVCEGFVEEIDPEIMVRSMSGFHLCEKRYTLRAIAPEEVRRAIKAQKAI